MSGKDNKDRAAKMKALRKALRDATPAVILNADAMKDQRPARNDSVGNRARWRIECV